MTRISNAHGAINLSQGFPDVYYSRLLTTYTAKREQFLGYLESAGLPYAAPQGAYYVMVDISQFGASGDVGFCDWLVREVGVAAVPGSSFFREPVRHLIRFHFAKKEETLVEAGKRLATVHDAWKRAGGRNFVAAPIVVNSRVPECRGGVACEPLSS
jgi:aspartate/methionine/tyrosine aminotransferase